jgi:hypothetical protein
MVNGMIDVSCFAAAIIGDAVPRLGVVAIDGNLESNLRLVLEAPISMPQLRVD